MMVKMINLSDDELVALLNQGNHAAFTEIYNRYWQILYMHAYQMLRYEDEALDVVQDTFTSLWLHAENLHITTSLRAYLYTSTRNHTLNKISKGKTRQQHLDSFAHFIEEGRSLTEETVNYNELLKHYEAEVANLPPKMQQIFVKSRVEGLSHKAIAQELGIAENTVKTIINRALRTLRGRLTVDVTAVLYYFLFF